MPQNNLEEYVDSNTIKNMLPDNARAYYKEGQANFDIQSILHHHSSSKNMLRKIGLVFSFPINGWRINLVRDGQVGLATYQEKFVFKGPGYQFVLDPRNKIEKVVDIGDLKIIHGPKKLVRVSQGQLRFAINNNNGKPMLLGPGTHYFDDPCIEILNSITFDKGKNAENADNMQFQITEQLTFVRVGQGNKGIAYKGDGQIELLEPGLHLLEWPRHFHSIVSTKQEILPLGESKYLTLDSVEFSISPSLAYKLIDPLTAYSLGITNQKDINNTLKTKATSALIQAMRQVNAREAGTFRMKAEQKEMPTEFDMKVKAEQLAAVNFAEVQNSTRKIFIESLQTDFGNQYGFEIESLDFNKFDYAERYQNILTQTIDNTIEKAKIEAQENMLPAQIRMAKATAEKDKTVAIIKVQAKAEVEVKQAEADAQAKKINAENEAMVIRIKAEAQAQAVRQQAGAEAFKIAALGEAERQRLESIAKGQKAYAQAVGETTHGPALAMAEVYEKGIKALSDGGTNIVITSEQMGLNYMFERFLEGSKNTAVPNARLSSGPQEDMKVADEARRTGNRNH
jgi:regulator of protease activity HflC (stomatin/prohibitin superfamily)